MPPPTPGRQIAYWSSLVWATLFAQTAFTQVFPPPTVRWDRSLNGSAWSLRGLPNGGVVAAGYALTNGADFNLAQLDAAGQTLWQRSYGGNRYEDARDVVPASDGGFVAVGRSESGANGDKSDPSFGDSDCWVLRTDSSGNKLWDAGFGGSLNDLAQAVVQMNDGSFLVAGDSFSPAGGNKTSPRIGLWDVWLVCVSTNGGKLWEASYGGTGNEGVYALAQTADGRYVFAGYTESSQSGNMDSGSHGSWDLWVGCVDTNGVKLWDRSVGGTGFDYAEDIQATGDGGLIAAGYSSSGVTGNKSSPHRGGGDGWAVRFNSVGDKMWDRTFGTTSVEVFHSVAVLPDGGFIFAGEQRHDFWVVRTDAAGEVLWERTFSAPAQDRAHGVVAFPNGQTVVSGILDIDGDETTRLLKFERDVPLLLRPRLADGGFSFSLNGMSNDYAIEFSTNLFDWAVLGTNRVSETGKEVIVLDPAGASSSRRFYRARQID